MVAGRCNQSFFSSTTSATLQSSEFYRSGDSRTSRLKTLPKSQWHVDRSEVRVADYPPRKVVCYCFPPAIGWPLLARLSVRDASTLISPQRFPSPTYLF